MEIKIRFLGAARNVTGSRYLVEALGLRILVDCGMYQERHLKHRNWDPFPVAPVDVDAVLLTHAHLDHVGYLPRFVKFGFAGPVHCTPATAEIAKIVVLDSGRIQEEDAARKARRHKRQKRKGPHPVVPLYTEDDAEACLHRFRTVPYGTPVELAEGLSAVFREAGHILGSSMLELTVRSAGETRTVVFSGDVGRWEKPILRDPTLFERADYLVVESTYGDRTHGHEGDVQAVLAEVVKETAADGGNVVIPSFAIERAHELMYHINELREGGRIPPLPVFIDSPMAIRVTEVFVKHEELFDEEMTDFVERNRSPFDFQGLTMTRTAAESKKINGVPMPSIIIAGSGMCTGGRIKHHLAHNIGRHESTILFSGYQAVGTLGRIILEGTDPVRILGRNHRVRARIARVRGFSGHADRDELWRWVSHMEAPRRIFVTHGEEEAALHFAELLRERLGVPVDVPEFGDEATLT